MHLLEMPPYFRRSLVLCKRQPDRADALFAAKANGHAFPAKARIALVRNTMLHLHVRTIDSDARDFLSVFLSIKKNSLAMMQIICATTRTEKVCHAACVYGLNQLRIHTRLLKYCADYCSSIAPRSTGFLATADNQLTKRADRG